MRTFGGVLVLVGLFGFYYCSTRLTAAGPVPEGKSISQSLEYEAGKWEIARYGAAIVGAFGLLMSFFPKGR